MTNPFMCNHTIDVIMHVPVHTDLSNLLQKAMCTHIMGLMACAIVRSWLYWLDHFEEVLAFKYSIILWMHFVVMCFFCHTALTWVNLNVYSHHWPGNIQCSILSYCKWDSPLCDWEYHHHCTVSKYLEHLWNQLKRSPMSIFEPSALPGEYWSPREDCHWGMGLKPIKESPTSIFEPSALPGKYGWPREDCHWGMGHIHNHKVVNFICK